MSLRSVLNRQPKSLEDTLAGKRVSDIPKEEQNPLIAINPFRIPIKVYNWYIKHDESYTKIAREAIIKHYENYKPGKYR